MCSRGSLKGYVPMLAQVFFIVKDTKRYDIGALPCKCDDCKPRQRMLEKFGQCPWHCSLANEFFIHPRREGSLED
jgi:hypothetical protein